MPIHLYNLFARSFMSIPATLGSNWFGLVFTIFVILIGEFIGGLLFGWQAVMTNWKKVTGIGFAALGVGYTLVFLWCIVTTTYSDHNALNTHIGELSKTVHAAAANQANAVQNIRNDLGGQLTDLRQTCAETRGENKSLSKQASDQQGTINNCQTQALKLLTPEEQKITILPWEDTSTDQLNHHSTYLLITNKVVTPVHIEGGCDVNLTTISAQPVGAGAYAGGADLLPSARRQFGQFDGRFEISFSTPAWTPVSPIRMDVTYTSSRTAICQFFVR